MSDQLETVIWKLLQQKLDHNSSIVFEPDQVLNFNLEDTSSVARALNAAFLIALSGDSFPSFAPATDLLHQLANSPEWGSVARFYLSGLDRIKEEIKSVREETPDFNERLNALANRIEDSSYPENSREMSEHYWSAFFPEASGILANREARVQQLREYRTVEITELNPTPITDPARQILFTSNILLTLPQDLSSIEGLSLSEEKKQLIRQSAQESQSYWYDHPIQIGVEPENNEVLYGLRGLTEALEFERARGNTSQDARITCVLSVSVTHPGLAQVAKSYLEMELAHAPDFKHLDVYVFTELDTQRIIDEILIPASRHFLDRKATEELFGIFGVDGEYGRHYNFLKAISAFWEIFINPEIKGTFKIDLDQVFPQKELLEGSSGSAFDHFKTPLWGARGLDSEGQQVELGMIAGALVNENDIAKSLFTPDIPFPEGPSTPDEYIFFSKLPQALSTESEMMTRYDSQGLDGRHTCIQRFHVTGGTNGILINSLRHYRPFTPSFIGRAEDQAYILSTFSKPGTRLAYAHEAGLFMRHDKGSFAQEAIKSAHVGKLIGDYVRLIYFSAYAKVVTDDITNLKATLDPFTGCFISLIPITIVYLRFALKATSFSATGENAVGLEFIKIGSERITEALDFIDGENSPMKTCYQNELRGWDLYYDTLSAIELALSDGDQFAQELQERAQCIISKCYIE